MVLRQWLATGIKRHYLNLLPLYHTLIRHCNHRVSTLEFPARIIRRPADHIHLNTPSDVFTQSIVIPISYKMVLPHQSPYVTPHILHRNYAQSYDNESSSKRERSSPCPVSHDLIPTLAVIGRDLEYFSQAGFDMDRIQLKRNASAAQLYEDAVRNEGAIISSSGALINFSGKKTGRSPKDKRIVYEDTSKDDIWWGSVNIKMDERESPLYSLSPR